MPYQLGDEVTLLITTLYIFNKFRTFEPKFVEAREGIEPPTFRLWAWRATICCHLAMCRKSWIEQISHMVLSMYAFPNANFLYNKGKPTIVFFITCVYQFHHLSILIFIRWEGWNRTNNVRASKAFEVTINLTTY